MNKKNFSIILPMLKTLSNSNSRKRKHLLCNASPLVIHGICAIISNILNGNFPISQSDREKLKRYKNVLRRLSKLSVPLYERRYILEQKGGFLSALLIPAISVIANLIANKSL